ncbi:DUF3696 domain-containing protein [Parendozoicomonas haliclonae]|uniref:AAA domain-containing protein n=1 Tax=Parendozoicomonas haliclonae TaxID=1960125 RepID=A0A1X7AIQ7_9GAMM|nr:DUF3696 domain-containing protein [Parendozoicomonas haliclonae]SMA45569.1 hypothetical protein EHSB41UT_01952 [Parendozoicomonas haliclonae]
MRIKSLTLGGFKGIKDTATIPLAPITLLFGANSTGKSTILHGLLYLYEILANNNLDPEYSQLTGHKLSLGRFTDLLHCRDLDRVLTIGMSVDLEDQCDLLEHYMEEPDEILMHEHFGGQPEFYMHNWECRFEIAWSTHLGTPYIKAYESYADGRKVCRIEQKGGSKSAMVTHLEFFDQWLINHDLIDLEPIDKAVKSGGFPLDLNRVLTEYIKKVSFFWVPLPWEEVYDVGPEAGRAIVEVAFSQAVLAPLEDVVAYLKQLVHIGPLRTVPDNTFCTVKGRRPDRWYDGSGGWDALANDTSAIDAEPCDDLYARVLECFANPNLFDTPYNFRTHYTSDEAAHRIPGAYIYDDDIKQVQMLTEVGVGISQVVPVVVGMCHNNIKIVSCEQPELHIHPKWQLALADIMLWFHDDVPGKMFLMETHSEHILLRLLRRRRETVDGTLMNDDFSCASDDVQVIFCEKTKDGTRLTPINITDEGEFDAPWPNGFFEERRKELF